MNEAAKARWPGRDAAPDGPGRPALATFEEAWPLLPDLCACDLHLLDWLAEQALTEAAIFHFGTGAHHTLGREVARSGRRNAVLGITASPQEYAAYMDLLSAEPELGRHYHVLFDDIYLLNEKLLPRFDVVSLFHLGEYRSSRNDAYGAMSELELARMLHRRLRRGGHMLFYSGSLGWETAVPVIETLASTTGLERAPDHASLHVYRKP